MAFLNELTKFDKTKLDPAETVVRTFQFVEDTSDDDELHLVIENLYIASGGGAANFVELKQKRITHILNLAVGAVGNSYPNQFVYKNVRMLDVPDFDILSAFEECVQFVIESIENNIAGTTEAGRCLVHCNAGVSRSSSVIIAYLIKQKGLCYEKALEMVRVNRPQARPNDGFVDQLKQFEKQVKEAEE